MITPVRYDEGTLATNHNAATGDSMTPHLLVWRDVYRLEHTFSGPSGRRRGGGWSWIYIFLGAPSEVPALLQLYFSTNNTRRTSKYIFTSERGFLDWCNSSLVVIVVIRRIPVRVRTRALFVSRNERIGTRMRHT